MAGNCFDTAAHFVLDADDDTDLRVVHGTVVGTDKDGNVIVPRHSHAWVERTVHVTFPANDDHPEMSADFVECIDKANGNDSTMPQPFYYQAGRVDPDTVRRYTATETARLMIVTGHYGPWHDDGADL